MATGVDDKKQGISDASTLMGTSATIWHRTAPADVRHSGLDQQSDEAWESWVRHLSHRKRMLKLAKIFAADQSPLLWSLVGDAADSRRLIARLHAAIQGRPDADLPNRVDQWVADLASRPPSVPQAVDSLAWAYALPHLADVAGRRNWWRLLDSLLHLCGSMSADDLQSHPLRHQLLAGELRLVLAYFLPEIRVCRQQGRQSKRALSKGLIDLLDGEGLPAAAYLPLLRPLLGCWSRSLAVASRLHHDAFSRPALLQYEWLVRQALRLCRKDGSLVFSNGFAGHDAATLFDTALALAGDSDDFRIAKIVLPHRRNGSAKKKEPPSLPAAPLHSEWAEAAILRSGWSHDREMLVVNYANPQLEVELLAGGAPLLSGEWNFFVERDNRPATPDGIWDEVCWYSDKDVDYLELEMSFAEGFRLERQMLLAREDRFLMLADAIVGPRAGEVAYRGMLPLAQGVDVRPAGDTREIALACESGRHPRALCMPLALPEWRTDPRGGSFSAKGGELELSHCGHGSRLFAPLFFDLNPPRMRRPFTWRRLTVAENRKVQPPDTAVGFRVQCGSKQWVIYRSLARNTLRTVLGTTITSEFVVGRFTRSGELEPLIEIE